MNGKQSTVFGLIIAAGLINVAGRVADSQGKSTSRDPTAAIVGTFLVLVVLVAIASSQTFGSIAVAFAIAFLITSALLNGAPIIKAFDTLEGVKNG